MLEEDSSKLPGLGADFKTLLGEIVQTKDASLYSVALEFLGRLGYLAHLEDHPDLEERCEFQEGLARLRFSALNLAKRLRACGMLQLEEGKSIGEARIAILRFKDLHFPHPRYPQAVYESMVSAGVEGAREEHCELTVE